MRSACALALAVAVQASAAPAQIDDPFAKGLQDLTWAERPSEAVFQAAKPTGVPTRAYVILRCGAEADGCLADCKVHLEDPKGKGLAMAALSLVPSFRLEAGAARHVREVGADVFVQFNWRGDGGPCWPPYCSFIPVASIPVAPPAPVGSH
jgi:hypothetical protein